jgi:hypothetical protein
MKSKAAKDLRNKIYNTFEKLKAKERSPATAPVESCVPERSLETPEPVGFHQLKAVSVPTEDSTGDSLHESSYAGPRDSGAAAEDTSNDASEESSGAAPEGFNVADLVKTTDISSCLLIKARKTVHFSDLTKQGESPIDAGELLNYANPFVLKPIFEILLVLGVAARQNGNDVGPLNQLVKLRGAEQNGVH